MELSDKAKQSKLEWRIQLEYMYVLICKNCSRKILDPDKKNVNQLFTKAICPHCYKGKK